MIKSHGDQLRNVSADGRRLRLVVAGRDHDDVIKWKHFSRYWPFVWGIHWSPVNSPTKASNVELWCFFDLRLNKRLSKQSLDWWFETPSRSLWRHCNVLCISCYITREDIPYHKLRRCLTYFHFLSQIRRLYVSSLGVVLKKNPVKLLLKSRHQYKAMYFSIAYIKT